LPERFTTHDSTMTSATGRRFFSSRINVNVNGLITRTSRHSTTRGRLQARVRFDQRRHATIAQIASTTPKGQHTRFSNAIENVLDLRIKRHITFPPVCVASPQRPLLRGIARLGLSLFLGPFVNSQ